MGSWTKSTDQGLCVAVPWFILSYQLHQLVMLFPSLAPQEEVEDKEQGALSALKALSVNLCVACFKKHNEVIFF